jgi:hypothetical protein
MHPILRRIERHLQATDSHPTRFGRDALGDPRLVADLKKGRQPSAATVARIEAAIQARENAR